MYQPDWEETFALFISLACVSVMATLFGRKTAGTKLSTINYARGLVVALYLVSLIFSIIACMLVQTNNNNLLSCQLTILSCIVLYAFSKVIIYLFLMEKVYVVTAVGVTRANFFLYKVNMLLLTPYIGVVTLMVLYRNAVIEANEGGKCYIGLFRPGAIPLILYDIVVSIWLTFLFLKPLMSSSSLLQGPSKGKLRDVARRTLLGSLIALLLSSANIFSLVYSNGYERGLICMACCTLDVTLNAITIHWVTNRGKGGRQNTERSTVNRRGGRGVNSHSQQYGVGVGPDKQVGPLESHISVTVESYVEEYHQLHYGGTSSHHY
ncbi:MAG: hypothetical protein J3Q66DRAFT_328134 [Benniella sp.]|nr:MAG: hypothetical protein J3Q66DRAFT_328134 [Benniella sp.]